MGVVQQGGIQVVTDDGSEIVVIAFGDAGPPGTAVSAAVELYTADENLGGHKVVAVDAFGGAVLADKNTTDKVDVIGVSLNSALISELVNVQFAGTLTHSGFSFTPNMPVYLGISGVLTQVVPTSGFLVIVGVATAPTKLLIDPEPPLALI